jgi:hypothetical protein
MPPGKSVSTHKDTFFECQKMTIAEFFVKKAKKRGSGTKIRGFSTKMRGLALNMLRLENAKFNVPTKEKLLTIPHWVGSAYDVPKEFYEEESIDGKEIRHYPRIIPDCFESVYLGVNMLPRKKEQIIEIARDLNPNIHIYQITLAPNAFKLKPILVE